MITVICVLLGVIFFITITWWELEALHKKTDKVIDRVNILWDHHIKNL